MRGRRSSSLTHAHRRREAGQGQDWAMGGGIDGGRRQRPCTHKREEGTKVTAHSATTPQGCISTARPRRNTAPQPSQGDHHPPQPVQSAQLPSHRPSRPGYMLDMSTRSHWPNRWGAHLKERLDACATVLASAGRGPSIPRLPEPAVIVSQTYISTEKVLRPSWAPARPCGRSARRWRRRECTK